MEMTMNLKIDSASDPLALIRVLSTCARRRFEVQHFAFDAATGDACLTVSGTRQDVRRLEQWLNRHRAVALAGHGADQSRWET